MDNALSFLAKLLKSRDFWVRVLVILIAAIFWLLIKLSKNGYVTSLEYPVLYENIPQNKILVGEASQLISLRISSFGFRLLGYELKRENPLLIDVKRHTRKIKGSKDVYYWLPNLYREELQSQLDGQTSLLRLEPDTVYLVLSEKIKKEVPIKFEVENQFKTGYEAYGSGIITPQKITVSGPKVLLDSLEFLATKKRVRKEIGADLDEELQIVKDEPLLQLSQNTVRYQLEVDQFTEKVLEVPVRVTNVPKGNKANIIPSTIQVYCKVALRDVERLESKDVEVICDFAQLKEFPNRKKLQLTVKAVNKGFEIIRYSQLNADYLLFAQ